MLPDRNQPHLARSKRVINQRDQVRQQSSEIVASGDLAISAESGLVVSASELQAGDEAWLVGGENLALLSGGDQTYQAARLQSGFDLTLSSAGEIAFAARQRHRRQWPKNPTKSPPFPSCWRCWSSRGDRHPRCYGLPALDRPGHPERPGMTTSSPV